SMLERQKLVAGRAICEFDGIKLNALRLTTSFQRVLPSCVADQDPPHGFCRGSEEVAAAVPVRGLTRNGQAQIGLVDQGCGLKSVPGAFLCHLLSRELA